MARGVRLNPKHDERTRAKIKTSQIINRLMLHINGEVEMSSSQVRSAEILLKKTLPDLQSVEYVAFIQHENKPIIIYDDIPFVTDEEAARAYAEEMKQL